MDEEKISMAQSLREMAVNEKKTFMLDKRDSAISTIQRLKFKGYKFRCKTLIHRNIFVVTKILNP